MPTIEEVQAALEEANERYRVALLDGLQHSLLLLALGVRESFPTATAILLGQSDQGEFVDIDEIELPDADVDEATFGDLQEAYLDEYLSTAWNLRTDTWTEWQTFCDPEFERRWGWRLLIDPVLEYEGDFTRHIADRQEWYENRPEGVELPGHKEGKA